MSDWAAGDKAYLLTVVMAESTAANGTPVVDPTTFEITQVTVHEPKYDVPNDVLVKYDDNSTTSFDARFLLTEEQAKKFDSSLGKPGGWRVP